MTLKEERIKFTSDIAKLINYINTYDKGQYKCAGGEWLRPDVVAKIYAEKGIGIENSVHCVGLGMDMIIYKNGVYLTKSEDYRFAGLFWKALDPENVWGGDFRKKDGNHFSNKYAGRM